MRVLHVISDENIGGAGVLLTSLLKNMDSTRVESIVAMPQGSLLKKRIADLKIPIHLLKYPCDRVNFYSVRELQRIIKRDHIDIVHANAAICARVAGRMFGRIVLHTRHCCFPPKGVWRLWLIRRICGFGNQMLSDRVIATADAAAENLMMLGISSEQIEVVINGSEPIRAVSENELDVLRERFEIEKADFCIGICARLEKYKGHDVFLAAAKRVVAKMPCRKVCFLIVGEGSMRETLQKQVKEEGMTSFVRFTGFVEDMAPIYHLLDLNVNCSRGTETSCLALSEGMSAGLPFVASDFGGNVAMKGGSEAGVLFSVDDAEELSEAICKIASDPMLYKRMRLAAYARYQEKYTAVQMGDHLTAVYENLMKSKYEGSRLQH